MSRMVYMPGRYAPHQQESVEARLCAIEQYLVSTGEELELLIRRLNEVLEAVESIGTTAAVSEN